MSRPRFDPATIRRSTPPSPSPLTLSIVVPAFNEEKLLPRSLPAIHSAATAFHPLGWSWELIVCDNNSTDRTADIARTHGARVVFEPINQIARARNAGAAAATGQWLVFIDADSYPDPPLFADLAHTIATGTVLAGGATVRFADLTGPRQRSVHLWNAISRLCRWAAGSFLFSQTAAFQEVGGFNPNLFASEEIDLSRRLKRLARQRGLRFVILTRHPQATSPRKIQLYSPRELLGFFLRAALRPRTVLRQRQACSIWYDGRR